MDSFIRRDFVQIRCTVESSVKIKFYSLIEMSAFKRPHLTDFTLERYKYIDINMDLLLLSGCLLWISTQRYKLLIV